METYFPIDILSYSFCPSLGLFISFSVFTFLLCQISLNVSVFPAFSALIIYCFLSCHLLSFSFFSMTNVETAGAASEIRTQNLLLESHKWFISATLNSTLTSVPGIRARNYR